MSNYKRADEGGSNLLRVLFITSNVVAGVPMPLPHSTSDTSNARKEQPSADIVSQSVPVSPEELLISEKSTRIRQWVKRRLEEVGG